jgi:nicotinamidase-related amidase
MFIILNVCLGINRPGSLISNIKNLNILKNIIQLSEKFDSCFIFNDKHKKHDKEFNFLPEHCLELTGDSCPDLDIINSLKCKNNGIFYKNTLSILKNNHIKEMIKNISPPEINLCGFNLSTDILHTALDFLSEGYNINIYKDCCGDYLNNSYVFDLLQQLNIKIL